jgi:hypothetical protein
MTAERSYRAKRGNTPSSIGAFGASEANPMTKNLDHVWMYNSTSPDTVCARCGVRRDEAPLESGGSQRFAPCNPLVAPDDARRLQIIQDEINEALSRLHIRCDCYVLDDAGNPTPEPDLFAWGKFMADTRNERQVARDQIGTVLISTVFLGVDHGWGNGRSAPVLWETRVFGGPLDQTQERYTSRADALAGHARWVNAVEETQDAPP